MNSQTPASRCCHRLVSTAAMSSAHQPANELSLASVGFFPRHRTSDCLDLRPHDLREWCHNVVMNLDFQHFGTTRGDPGWGTGSGSGSGGGTAGVELRAPELS